MILFSLACEIAVVMEIDVLVRSIWFIIIQQDVAHLHINVFVVDKPKSVWSNWCRTFCMMIGLFYCNAKKLRVNKNKMNTI